MSSTLVVGVPIVALPATTAPPCGSARAAADIAMHTAKLRGRNAKRGAVAERAVILGRVFMRHSLDVALSRMNRGRTYRAAAMSERLVGDEVDPGLLHDGVVHRLAADRPRERQARREVARPVPDGTDAQTRERRAVDEVRIGDDGARRVVAEADRADVVEGRENEFSRDATEPRFRRQIAQLDRSDEARIAGPLAWREGAYAIGAAELELLGAVEVVDRVLALQARQQEQPIAEEVLQARKVEASKRVIRRVVVEAALLQRQLAVQRDELVGVDGTGQQIVALHGK